MKRLVSYIFLFFLAFQVQAQYGNEWIQFDQSYYKIPVAREGIYRITYEALLASGFPVSANPRTFQLFHRGKEQSILIQGEADEVFGPADYIEFYGVGNDGTLDSTLYGAPGQQPHKLYNLYSDTTSYFLTVGSAEGKRILAYEQSPLGLTPQQFHVAEVLLLLKQNYFPGADYGNVRLTAFDAAEGWTGQQILQNQQVTYDLEGITDIAPAQGKPVLEVLLTGRGPMLHNVELSSATRTLGTIDFQGYTSYRHTQEIEWSDIDGTGKLSLKIRVTGMAGTDRVSAAYVRLRFPRVNLVDDDTDRVIMLPEGASSLLAFDDPPTVRFFDVTVSSDVRQLRVEPTDGLSVVVPQASVQRKILASAEVNIPARIKPVTFRPVVPGSQDYIIITHRSLRSPAVGYVDPVKAYAEYRSLPAGGGFDTLVMNIDQLYDQFNYGETSPRAIFQFMKFLASAQLPDYLFLIGKGLDVNYGFYRNPSAFTQYRDLVPTAGYPASDMAFTASLSGIPSVAAVATGRLTATTPAEVAAYLNKVKERDALSFDALWRKKILHLSGGIEEHEPAIFRGILHEFANVAEDVYLGGEVKALAKQNTGVKLVNIAEEVNAGVGLITFFGHSAPNTLDFDIGLVTDPIMGYDNNQKYPFLLMNGCDGGSFFLNATIFGENWIKTPDKGAIGFIAHSSYGLVSGLQRYSSTFYDVAFGDSVFITKSIGQVQTEVARRYIAKTGTSALSTSQVQQMVLLGDPAVKIFGAEKPDYEIHSDRIFVSTFNDEPITALADSFLIHIPVRNFGVAGDENIRLEITRQYGDVQYRFDSVFSGTLFSDTLSVIVRSTDDAGFGLNTFTIFLDADNAVDELSETNNQITFEYMIPLNRTRNLYPYEFSIVQNSSVDFSFQYTDLLTGPRVYVLELDTLHTFSSAFKQQFELTSEALARLNIELPGTDSVVYYWRTRLAQPLEHESKDWSVSSFTFISNGPEGWAQMDFPQFDRNESNGIVKDPELRRMEFSETVSDVAVRTFSAASGTPQDSIRFRVNGVEFNLMREGGVCRNNTLNLVAFDRRSTQPYAGIYFKWYELLYEYGGRRLLCGREPYVINSFTPQELITGNNDDLAQYIDNIQAGDSVVLFNIGNAGFSQWPQAARDKLGALGISAAQLEPLMDGDPVVIFARKGSSPGTASIYHHPSAPSVEVHKTVAGRFTSGTMSSTLIGPARSWDQFRLKVAEVDLPDTFHFTILGVRPDNHTDTLKANLVANTDLTDISAETYPWLKVVMASEDGLDLTAVQLKTWMVLFEPSPEGLIFSRGIPERESVQEGQPFSRDYGFINISNKAFADSLEVEYALLNHNNPSRTPAGVRIAAPAPGDTTLFTVAFSTVSKSGLNDVEVYVNPEIQREQFYENNRIVIREHLDVLTDQSHPVLEVTFDGRYLENNAFVQANPEITIRLWDENPFLLKQDTLGMRIFLSYPCDTEECPYQRVFFSREDIAWIPASEGKDYTVNFLPRDLDDGQYRLRIEAQDHSGNPSGDIPYEVHFIVASEVSITGLPPYPNPFSEATNFDIVVTGAADLPYFFTLQITDINGREVMGWSDQNGGLFVGRNSFAWDGTSDDGSRLPRGVYLYRMFVSDGIKDHEYAGKVVLLR